MIIVLCEIMDQEQVVIKGDVIGVEQLGFLYPFSGVWGLCSIGLFDGLSSPFVFAGSGFCIDDEVLSVLIIIVSAWVGGCIIVGGAIGGCILGGCIIVGGAYAYFVFSF